MSQASGDANDLLQCLLVCGCLWWLCWLQLRLCSVCVGFGVQVFVGDFLYVTCVSVRFKVEFISRLLVSFKSTGCYHMMIIFNTAISFNTMGSDTEILPFYEMWSIMLF